MYLSGAGSQLASYVTSTPITQIRSAPRDVLAAPAAADARFFYPVRAMQPLNLMCMARPIAPPLLGAILDSLLDEHFCRCCGVIEPASLSCVAGYRADSQRTSCPLARAIQQRLGWRDAY